jgi:lauroyl/myristoyl acyltransferase
LELWGCELLAFGLPRLSRRWCIRISEALGSLACLLDPKGRAVAHANLTCVFGARYTPAERSTIVRQSYQNFARTMFDLFWFQRLTAETVDEWVKFEGDWDGIRARAREEKRGIIYMCVHQGNWEWANQGGGFHGTKNMTVVQTFKNDLLTQLFKRLREHSGSVIIPQHQALLRMLREAKRGGTLALLIDLNLRPSEYAAVLEMFKPAAVDPTGESNDGEGMKSCAPLIHVAIAQRTRAFLVPAITEPRPDGTVRVIVKPPVEFTDDTTPAEIAQRCWDAFEPVVLANPGGYLWPYKHFRYRPDDAPRPYPSYSNHSAKFEKLLRTLERESKV